MGAGTAESSVHSEKWSLDTPESKACPDAGFCRSSLSEKVGELEQSSGATLRHAELTLWYLLLMHFAKHSLGQSTGMLPPPTYYVASGDTG